jgi:DNA-binding MarR family transcriptional regulator
MPDQTQRTWTSAESEAAFDVLGDRLIEGTRRFSRSTRRQRLQAELYTVGGRELGLAQVDALEVVAERDARMHELAARLGLDPSTVTRTTAPLVELGLLERFTDPGNRRYVVLRCTPAGRRVAERLVSGRRELMRAVLAPMEPERRLLFAELLDEYIDHIERYQAEHESSEAASWSWSRQRAALPEIEAAMLCTHNKVEVMVSEFRT